MFSRGRTLSLSFSAFWMSYLSCTKAFLEQSVIWRMPQTIMRHLSTFWSPGLSFHYYFENFVLRLWQWVCVCVFFILSAWMAKMTYTGTQLIWPTMEPKTLAVLAYSRLSDGRDSTKICKGTALLTPHAFFALVSSIHAFPNILEPGTGSIVWVCLNLPD